jgi:pyruvate, water dikinase
MTAVMWFEGFWEGMRPEVGGKAASLGELTGAGLPVPPGFVLTTDAYRTCRDLANLDESVSRLLGGLDAADMAMVSERCALIREAIMRMPMTSDVEQSLRRAYAELSRRCGIADIPVAVRSSASGEDSPDASFAGEHDTFLWVRGADDVVDAVRRCWASLFTDRATCYRFEMGYDHRAVEMGVVVQKMVRPVAAGVAFTLNPADGDRSTVAIDAAWGFGEGVVSGEVTPDNYLVDKVLFEISRRAVSRKDHEYRLTEGETVERATVDDERATAPCLTDAQVTAVARLARLAERHFGAPQDVEWAIDADLPDGENVILLQSRPETVWSRKPPRPVAEPGADFMSSIVATLMSPLHAGRATEAERG